MLLARNAPIGVIFRRGPSDWVQLIRWNTDRDSFDAVFATNVTGAMLVRNFEESRTLIHIHQPELFRRNWQVDGRDSVTMSS